MDGAGIKVVHAIPGRIRLKISQVKEDSAFAEEIHRQLSAVQSVQWVETNQVTGSVLVLYDVEEIASPESLRALPDLLLRVFPGLDAEEIKNWLDSAQNGVHPTSPFAQNISALLGTLNTRVGKATGGADLKVLLPLTLFILGIRGLFVSEKVVFPTWYDLLWFAFGTFAMLNRSVIEGNEQFIVPPSKRDGGLS